MAQRKFKFVEGEYYHIFNRGVDKRDVFVDKGDLYHFLDSLVIVNSEHINFNRHIGWRKKAREKIQKQNKSLVAIIAYALLPNHFHLVVTPLVEEGVSKFMQRLGTSHTKFFNEKYERSGSLFQGKFKAKQLASDRALEFLSVYVNLNYKYHRINTKKSIIKTSLFEYLGTEKGVSICDNTKIKEIINNLGGVNKYKKYLKKQSEFFANKKGFNAEVLKFEELEYFCTSKACAKRIS